MKIEVCDLCGKKVDEYSRTNCDLNYKAEYEKMKLHYLEKAEQKAQCLNKIVSEKERELEIARAKLDMLYLIFGK